MKDGLTWILENENILRFSRIEKAAKIPRHYISKHKKGVIKMPPEYRARLTDYVNDLRDNGLRLCAAALNKL